MTTRTLTASEFKAKCLDILERLGDRRLDRVVVTKRGRPVAVLTPPDAEAKDVRQIYGFLRGSVLVPGEIDLTEPVLDDALGAGEGELYG